MKVKSMKGFTLAELLIVMAIVVVLAAVAVPTFAKQMETARETNDLEVLRNAYTDAYTQAMKDIQNNGALNTNGQYTVGSLTFVQQSATFQYITPKIAGHVMNGSGENTIEKTHNQAVFTFTISDDDGGLSLSTVTTSTASSGTTP